MISPLVSDQVVFKSTDHPGDLPGAYIYLQVLGRAFLWCTLPLMLGATATVLMEGDPLPFLIWGLPVAVLAATGWTLFHLNRRIAMIRITDGHVAVYSVWDVVHNRPPITGPLLHAERSYKGVRASIGDAVYTFQAESWLEFEELLGTLRKHMGR